MMNANIAGHPLTPTQQGMLFHQLSSPGSGVDIEQIVCRLHHPVDSERLLSCWKEVVRQHEALRMRFLWESSSDPLQISDSTGVPTMERLDWRSLDSESLDPSLTELLEAERRRGFDLSDAPSMRLVLIQCGESSWLLVWTFHHILLYRIK